VAHRIPTPLVRQATIAVGALLILASADVGDWRAALHAGAACVVSFVLCMIGWRFAGLGRGDARLAALGGLGLGWSSPQSIALGLIALCAISLLQVVCVLSRGGGRRTMIAYALPLSVGFLVAATAI
jgi:leader peptidase (prepilin peptidase)/N-methyltransferase